MKPTGDERWRDLLVRRPLSPAERAEFEQWLAGHPDVHASLLEESRLTAALHSLPSAPVPSNFAARVLAEIRRPTPVTRSTSFAGWLGWLTDWRHAVPVAASIGTLVLTLGLQAHYRGEARRQLAHSIAALPLEGLGATQLWQDFDPIHGLPLNPLPSGEELAAALE